MNSFIIKVGFVENYSNSNVVSSVTIQRHCSMNAGELMLNTYDIPC